MSTMILFMRKLPNFMGLNTTLRYVCIDTHVSTQKKNSEICRFFALQSSKHCNFSTHLSSLLRTGMVYELERVLRECDDFFCSMSVTYDGAISFTGRTHLCGQLRVGDVGKDVVLFGWLQYKRLGKFLLLRDWQGMVQILVNEEKTKQRHSPSSPDLPAHTFNSDDGLIEEEFSVIATMQQKEGSYMGLAVISGTLVAMSLHLRQVALSADTSLINGDLMPTAEPRERSMTMQLLQTMGSSRCAFGACIWDDCIIVCGGYNRGECLASMEIYEPCQGQWLDMPDMLTARARFGAALLNTFLYTIGGCDGITDLDSVHRFDFSCKTWDVVASLQTARSSVGVAELDGSLYCVGGSDGQLSLKSCEVYSCKLDTWNFVSPLLIGRSQVSVVACKGSLLAVGGLDSWNCLSSVEMYSPVTDTWTMVAALSTVRRGAGVDVVGDDVWVVGGSNGSASLRTSEIFSFHANSWRPGPSLSVPRANMSAVFFNDKLYAIGGFSGKKFLNTLEILSFPSQEWSSYQPAISTHPDGSFFGAEHKPIPTPDTCNLALLVQQ